MSRPTRALCRRLVAALALSAVMASAARAAVSLPDTGLFAPVARQMRAIAPLTEVPPGGTAITPAFLGILLEAGNPQIALALLPQLRGDARATDLGRARVLLANVSLKGLRPVIERIAARPDPTLAERWVVYSALFAYDDPARIDSLSRAPVHPGPADLLAAGRLAYERLDYPRADSCFTAAIAVAEAMSSEDARTFANTVARPLGLAGLAQVMQKRRDWDGSLAKLQQAMDVHVTPEVLMALTETLIRLGRTDEAISASEWAVRMNPFSDAAHYMLGNGYARKNYTELRAAYPRAFADRVGRTALARADRRLAAGDRAGARRAYGALRARHSEWVDAAIRLASLDFEDGKFEDARGLCFTALVTCPEYGRAHAVLAKALESQRFEVDVHRPGYERRFTAAPTPKVPGIEKFVVNWKSLSPRHQKRVALSIAPWTRFVPVLVEGGATFYIKPLYMMLSEAPYMETLKDQRINYDSRLWDDVRGAGGYHTVTGIEDVERTIFDRYNTVLHELSHQVHAVLTADQSREIQEHYRRAKARDDVSKDGFLSRYAGGSVYEYFAEGANALESPKRDAYDPREVVRERLVAMDPDLMKLVQRLFALRDVSGSYPVAYVNAGDDRVERGKVDEALPYYRKALARAPREETAMQSLTRALTLGNRGAAAVAAADSALAAHPTSGGVVTTAASAYWHGGRGVEAAAALLDRSRATVRAEDRYQVDLARGGYAWHRGDATAALAAYDSVLAYQSDQPEGLWGRASGLALAGRWDDAIPAYDRAVRMRTGVTGLRCDYARDLLRAGRIREAKTQLDEAKLLDAEDPTAEALRGWADLAAGDAAAAKTHAQQALAWGPWSDLARIVLGRAELAAGHGEAARAAWAPVRERIANHAPPEFVYRARLSTWQAVHELPAVERALLDQTP